MNKSLFFVVGLLVLCFWAIAGMFIWIPLLLRSVANYCWVLTVNSVIDLEEEQETNRLNQAQEVLDWATIFYVDRFTKIIRLFDEPRSTPRPQRKKFQSLNFSIWEYLDDIAIFVIFWAGAWYLAQSYLAISIVWFAVAALFLLTTLAVSLCIFLGAIKAFVYIVKLPFNKPDDSVQRLNPPQHEERQSDMNEKDKNKSIA